MLLNGAAVVPLNPYEAVSLVSVQRCSRGACLCTGSLYAAEKGVRVTSSRDFKVAAALLFLSLLIGGAGLSFPLLQLLLQLSGCAVLAYLLVTTRQLPSDRLTRAALVVLALAVAIPLIQLIPLPPVVWQHLPGREAPAQLDAILGWSRWRPITLDSGATVAAFSTLPAVAATFLICAFLRFNELVRLLWIVVGLAVLGAALGIVQFVTGGRLTPYPSSHLGYAVGLFVNRNHNATLLLIAMPMTASLAALELRRGRSRIPTLVAAVSVILLLCVAVLGTTSRMGLALLPVALGVGLFILFYRQPPWRIALPSLLAFAALALVLFVSGGFDRTLARFSSLSDPRLGYWSNIKWALGHYGLVGTGLGTFLPVYNSAETLDSVVPAVTIHAHNDFLELLLEGGVATVLVFGLFLAVLGIALFRCAKSQRPERAAPTVAAASGILLIAIFSLVDYPVRMPAIGSVLALLLVVLLRGGAVQRPASRQLALRNSRPTAPGTWSKVQVRLGIVATAALAFVVGDQAIAMYQIDRGNFGSAARSAPWSSRARERLATEYILDGDLAGALRAGLATLKLAPIDAAAIRTVGAVRLAEDKTASGSRLMGLALSLGWRDPLSQLWGIEAAVTSREPTKAVQRAEALFRQNRATAAALSELLVAPPEAGIRPVLVTSLAAHPDWRDSFFSASHHLRGADADRFRELLAALADSRGPATVTEVAPLISNLISAGEVERAQAIWQVVRRGRLVANGDFEQVDAHDVVASPANWSTHKPYGNRIRLDRINGGHGHILVLSEVGSSTLLSQQLMLAPGSYRLSYDALASGSPAAIRWELRCSGSHASSASSAVIPTGRNWHSIVGVLTVPDRHCPIQTLALKRVSGRIFGQLRLDNVELTTTDR